MDGKGGAGFRKTLSKQGGPADVRGKEMAIPAYAGTRKKRERGPVILKTPNTL